MKLRKGERGSATLYITRSAALRKLQLRLPDFRRMCILHNVYPRDPKKKLKGSDKTYYHVKDIAYLNRQPLLRHIRHARTHEKKYRKAIGIGDKTRALRLESTKPAAFLYDVVKKRYPTLVDALKDLDDALSTVALFASLPVDDEKGITSEVKADSIRLMDQFFFLVAKLKLLRKIFCSIKGYYIEIEYLQISITFLVPHQYPQDLPNNVDFKVLLTFLELYKCHLESVLYKIYQMETILYPPRAKISMYKAGLGFLSLISSKPNNLEKNAGVQTFEKKGNNEINQLNDTSASQDMVACSAPTPLDDNPEPRDVVETLFKTNTERNPEENLIFNNMFFFISREVPRNIFALIIMSHGGSVGWHGPHSPYSEEDQKITHYILDRPFPDDLVFFKNTREFIQPQWVFDSINEGALKPISDYEPGKILPPHRSPFATRTLAYDSVEGSVSFDPISNTLVSNELRNLKSGDGNEDDTDCTSAGDSQSDDGYSSSQEGKCNKEKQSNHKTELPENREIKSKKKRTHNSDESESTQRKLKRVERKKLEERQRQESLLSKKNKRLLSRINYGKKK